MNIRKQILSLLLILALSPVGEVAAETIAWRYDLEAAWQTTQTEGRPLLLFLTSDNCRYCVLMKDGTWRNPEVAAAVNAQFVPVEVNTAAQRHLIEILNVKILPTTLVISPSREVLERVSGHVSPAELLARFGRLPEATLPVGTSHDPPRHDRDGD